MVPDTTTDVRRSASGGMCDAVSKVRFPVLTNRRRERIFNVRKYNDTPSVKNDQVRIGLLNIRSTKISFEWNLVRGCILTTTGLRSFFDVVVLQSPRLSLLVVLKLRPVVFSNTVVVGITSKEAWPPIVGVPHFVCENTRHIRTDNEPTRWRSCLVVLACFLEIFEKQVLDVQL